MPAPEAPRSPITARSVCLGLYAAIFIGLFSAYNDCYLTNSYFVGNHFPVAAIAFVVILVLAVNTAARRYLGVRGLASHELLLIWGMVGMAGSLSSYSFVGYFPSFVVAPAYYATPSNQYAEYLLAHIPDWLVVSRDPESPALKWFMEGLPAGESIPWKAWIGPLVAWCGFALLLYAANFMLCAIFFQQWSRRERLIFPIVQVTQEVAEDPAPGKLLNSFFSNRLAWYGLAVPLVIWGIRGLHAFIPAIPSYQLAWPLYNIFPDRPWNQFTLHSAEVFFSVIGITFMLTREVGFSFWFFYVLYRLSFVYVAWLGSGGQGFFGDWENRFRSFGAGGGTLIMAFFLFWTARRALGEWFRRAVSGRTDRDQDVLPPWLALLIILGGLGAMLLWYILAGVEWWVGALAIIVFLAMLLVLTRIVAESGLFFLSAAPETYAFITRVLPIGWLSGPALSVLALHRGINTEDMRKVFMPYIINGLKAAEYGRMHLGKVMGVFGATTVIVLAISTFSFIATSYKYGAVNVESWASVMAPKYYLDDPVNRQKNPPDLDMLIVGETPVFPVNLAHTLFGGALVGAMLFFRAYVPWWPIHPFGFIMCGTWAIRRIWFSIFLGWAAKAGVMSFGGAHVYRRVLPFFLGLALGECVISLFWMLISLITGQSNQMIIP